MNTGTDAIRSVQRYVAEVLNEPELAEVAWLDPDSSEVLRWSPGKVAGDWAVDGEAWRFLLSRRSRRESRVTEDGVLVGVAAIGDDPRPAAAGAGVTLGVALVPATTVRTPGWDVVLWGDRAAPTYPFCIVKAAGASVSVGTALYADLTQPMHLTAYPSDAVDDVRAAALASERVRDQLERGIATGVGLGRPRRIPLYDYDLAGPGEPSDVRGDHDFLRVMDFGAELLPEPADPRLIAVVADLRVSWRRDGGLRRGTRTVASTRIQFVNP